MYLPGTSWKYWTNVVENNCMDEKLMLWFYAFEILLLDSLYYWNLNSFQLLHVTHRWENMRHFLPTYSITVLPIVLNIILLRSLVVSEALGPSSWHASFPRFSIKQYPMKMCNSWMHQSKIYRINFREKWKLYVSTDFENL